MTIHYVSDNTNPAPVVVTSSATMPSGYTVYEREAKGWITHQTRIDYKFAYEMYEMCIEGGAMGVQVELTTRAAGRPVEVIDVTDEFEAAYFDTSAQRDDDAKWADLRAAQMP